jgi:hypothetical protein
MSTLLAYQGFSWLRDFRRGKGHTLAGVPVLRNATTAVKRHNERSVCARKKKQIRKGREGREKGREGREKGREGKGQTLDFCLPQWYDAPNLFDSRFFDPDNQTLFGHLFGVHVHLLN